MSVDLFIQNGPTIFFPVVQEGIQLFWERKGVPGRLEFSVVKDETLNFQEGNPVKLTVDGRTLFYGFVFKKGRKANSPLIHVVAYDQTRYLKNKDTVIEEGLTASDLLRRLAMDFRLKLGTVEDTGYLLETIVEEDQTLFDMIQNALDETLTHTGKLYCLYDDGGSLNLRNIQSMRCDLLIDAETGETFDYESSIDAQTYTTIKLIYANSESGRREVYVAQNGEKINQWGVLQYFESLQTPIGAREKADALLRLYGTKTRNLTIKKVLGDVRVRAGSAVMVSLNLGDLIANQFMMVEKITHHFKEEEHFMDLTLVGGEFIA